MAAIKRTGKGRKTAWYVHFRFKHPDGATERVVKKSPVNTRRGAEEFERQLRAEMLENKKTIQEVRFKEFAREFQEVYFETGGRSGKGLKHGSRLSYESAIRVHLGPAFGNRLVHQISAKEIDRFKAKLSVGRSSKTVRDILAVLSKMLRIAKKWGHLREVPEIQLPAIERTRFRFLSDVETQGLLDAAGPYWRPPIYFAVMTGCRQGELWALERKQLDLDRGVAEIDRAVYRGVVGLPKHDRVRTVDLSPALVAFLRKHLRVVPMRSRLVFPKEDGSMRKERKADTGLRRSAKRAGIEPFGWHVLRHTFATRLVKAGQPLGVVQELLGHSDIKQTMIYAHLSPGMKREAVACLDEGIQTETVIHLSSKREAAS